MSRWPVPPPPRAWASAAASCAHARACRAGGRVNERMPRPAIRWRLCCVRSCARTRVAASPESLPAPAPVHLAASPRAVRLDPAPGGVRVRPSAGATWLGGGRTSSSVPASPTRYAPALVSVTYTVAKGTGLATIVSTSASKSHGIALMGRTVAEKIHCVQEILRYRKNGFTEYLRVWHYIFAVAYWVAKRLGRPAQTSTRWVRPGLGSSLRMVPSV